MFDRISGVYDVMNAIISGFQEPRWRRRAVVAAGVGIGDSVIDIATGTGKVAASLKDQVGPSGRVLGVDLAPKMIRRAQRAYADRPDDRLLVIGATLVAAATVGGQFVADETIALLGIEFDRHWPDE